MLYSRPIPSPLTATSGQLGRSPSPEQQIRQALYPLPPAGNSIEAPPLAEWDPIASGLKPGNWNTLIPGPNLSDERPRLLLASDDNLNLLQANRLAVLGPRRSGYEGAGGATAHHHPPAASFSKQRPE